MDMFAYVSQDAVLSNKPSKVVISMSAIAPRDPRANWERVLVVSVHTASKSQVMLCIYYEGKQPSDLAKIKNLAREALVTWLDNYIT